MDLEQINLKQDIIFKKLETMDEFLKLDKGDTIVVVWSDNFLCHTQKSKKIMMYKIYDAKHHSDEIICQIKDNHYFNYKMYLGLDTQNKNTSNARAVYKLEVIEEE